MKGGESETELVISSTAQGPAKNTIKIDMLLLTDSHKIIEAAKTKFYLDCWQSDTVTRYVSEGTVMQLYRPTRHYETVCHCLLGYVSVIFMIYCGITLLKFSSLSY